MKFDIGQFTNTDRGMPEEVTMEVVSDGDTRVALSVYYYFLDTNEPTENEIWLGKMKKEVELHTGENKISFKPSDLGSEWFPKSSYFRVFLSSPKDLQEKPEMYKTFGFHIPSRRERQ